MPWEDPDKLLRHKDGREAYFQRMLTSLILAAPYPKWNSRNVPSEKGLTFLRQLYESAYEEALSGSFEFVDEMSLPAIDDDAENKAPDYAVIAADRIWIIELKTEPASHRKDQMLNYERLARHHYPNRYLDMLYLTPTMRRQDSSNFSQSRYAHAFWSEIEHLISTTWLASPHAEEVALSTALLREISTLHTPRSTFIDRAAVIRDALRLAMEVQEDGVQRAVEVTALGLEDLLETRCRIAGAITRSNETPNVRPWIWYEATSGGKALTELGRSVGCELRLSRYSSRSVV